MGNTIPNKSFIYCTPFLDEVLDILVHYNTACNDKIKQADIKHLLDMNTITIDKYGKVSWICRPYTDGKYRVSKYHSDKSYRAKYKKLIEICNNPKLNDYRATSLSKAWFERNGKKTAGRYKTATI